MLVDSHAHLDSPGLSEQLPAVLQRAEEAGVRQILTIGCAGEDPQRISRVIQICEAHEPVYAALGVHPHDAHHWTPELESELADLMSHPKVVGWGEIGLDFFYDNSPVKTQEEVFVSQLERARRLGKPVVIHSRDAARRTRQLLQRHFAGESSPGGVMHCFTYGPEAADDFLSLGFHFGLGGILTFPRSEELRRVARQLPQERLLVETDSPYLAPVPYRGKPNEPAFVVKVAEKLAEVRNTSLPAIAQQTTSNFQTLFQLSS